MSVDNFKAGLADAGIILSAKDYDTLLQSSAHYSKVGKVIMIVVVVGVKSMAMSFYRLALINLVH